LRAAEANVWEAIPNVGHGKIAPDVAPLGVLEDAPNDPGFFGWAAVMHQIAHLFLADVIVPKEVGTVAGVSDCAHLDSPLVILRRLQRKNKCQRQRNDQDVAPDKGCWDCVLQLGLDEHAGGEFEKPCYLT
jgi:hypothetical protein